MAVLKNQTPSITTIMSIPDGKILDFLTKRFVNDTPEEYVRQNIEKALVRQYKYPIDSCKPEVSIKVGSASKRVDVVVFEENKPHMVITGCPSQSVRHSLARNAGIAKKLPTSQIMKRSRKDEQTIHQVWGSRNCRPPKGAPVHAPV